MLLIACANVANLLLAVRAGAAARAGDSPRARRQPLGPRASARRAKRSSSRSPAARSACCSRPGRSATFVALAAQPAAARQHDSHRRPRAGVHRRRLARSSGCSAACGRWSGCASASSPPRSAKAIRGPAAAAAAPSATGWSSPRLRVAFALLVGAGLLREEPDAARAARRRRPAPTHRDRVRRRAVRAALQDPDAAVRRSIATLLDAAARRLAASSRSALTSHLPMYRFGWNGEMTDRGRQPVGPARRAARRVSLDRRRLLQDDGDSAAAGTAASTGATGKGAPQVRRHQPRDGREVLARRRIRSANALRPGQRHRLVAGRRRRRQRALVRPRARSTPYELYRTIEQQPFASMTVVLRTTDRRSDVDRSERAADRLARSIRCCR